ncbi:MAG: 30S ribosomal protein S20 [Clostridia bacterium]|nr:30S ribosomal protein S20 [Clostridia bacterium]
MANAVVKKSKSVKKRIRSNERKAAYNKSAISALRTALKKARMAVANNDENKAQLVKDAQIALDKAAGKGLIHKNQAAHKKSELQLALNKA